MKTLSFFIIILLFFSYSKSKKIEQAVNKKHIDINVITDLNYIDGCGEYFVGINDKVSFLSNFSEFGIIN